MAFNRLLLTTKSEYFSEKIAICGRDQKQLFHITKNIMGDTGTTNMPSFVSPGALAQRFSDHFTDRVRHIRQGMCDRDDNHSSATRAALSDDVCFDGVPLINVMPITESDVERLVAVAPCKTCELDPIHAICIPGRPLDRNRPAANQERYRCGTRPKEHGYTCDARFVKRIRYDRARSLAYSAWAHIRYHGQSIGVAAILLERTTPECSCR